MRKEFCPYTSPIAIVIGDDLYWGCSVNCSGKCLESPKKDYENCEAFRIASERLSKESELKFLTE